MKWGVPRYTIEKKNIVLIHGFKDYCALLFFKGALLNDTKGILIKQTENVQASRQIRFTNVREIVEMESILKAYIYEAIEAEKAGLKVNFKKTTEFIIPEELQNKLDKTSRWKLLLMRWLQDGKEHTFIIFLHPSKPKLGSQGLKKEECSKFWVERD